MTASDPVILSGKCDNKDGPRRCVNTSEGLTHSSDLSREGLGMEPTRVCRSCGTEIPRNPKWSKAHYATRLYCNRACQVAFTPAVGLDYAVSESGCWEWLGHIDRNGYGKAYDPERPAGRRVDWAHRVSYRHHKGEIPNRHELDHVCENTRCINPDHLEPVTKAEHARRTMQRLGKDVLHTRAAMLRCGGLTYQEIADALGMAGKETAHTAVQSAIRKGLVDPEALPAQRPALDADDHEDMAALYALGIEQGEIAAWYGVHSATVSKILSHGGAA